MQKIALYRKYRPENFDQTIGQDHIIRILSNAVSEKKISHAYLFSGPRGTGKTSLARIMAKAINCTGRKDHNPCGKCPICLGIAEGRIMDLLEIDAASNRGIDEIRDLREKVKFSPSEGEFKVFIIDEVHMLTKEAFNALLKTLEEPPTHAIFILATTEINKVPATIISRCQRHDFRRIKLSDIVTRLSEIKKAEKINVTDEALELIAEASEGGLRDAISILDQLASVGLEKIEEKDVESILGLAPHKIISGVTRNLLEGKKKEALSVLEKSATDGVDLVILSKSAMEYLRKILSVKIGGEETIEGTKEQINELKEVALATDQNKIIRLLDSFFWAQSVLKTNVDPKAILTVVCAKDYEIQETKEQKSEAVAPASAKEKPEPKKEVAGEAKKQLKPNGKWQHFLMEIKAKNNTIHAFLRVANPEFAGNKVMLTFPYKFHKERIEESRTRRMVEEILKKVYGEELIIECKMEGGHRNHKVTDVDTAASILGGEIVD